MCESDIPRIHSNTVRSVHQKFALLISNMNFDDLRPARFQRLSASLGGSFEYCFAWMITARPQNYSHLLYSSGHISTTPWATAHGTCETFSIASAMSAASIMANPAIDNADDMNGPLRVSR